VSGRSGRSTSNRWALSLANDRTLPAYERTARGLLIPGAGGARDQYRDVAKRQNAATRQRAGARGAAHTANERTDVKATIFGEALDRLDR